MESVQSALKSELKRTTVTCPEHGPYHAVEVPGAAIPMCPECEYLANKEQAALVSEETRQKRILSLLKEAGVPSRFQPATFGNFIAAEPRQKQALKSAAEYAANFSIGVKIGRCLAFVGNPGTGKTHLAAAIVREVLAAGYTARFTTVGDYVRQIKDYCWGNKKAPRLEGEEIQEYCKPHLLVLDEVGVQFGSTAEEILIFTLINKRYEEMRPTLVISNEEEDGLEKYLGERVFDRLKDGGGQIIPFEWESVRGQDLSNKGATRQ